MGRLAGVVLKAGGIGDQGQDGVGRGEVGIGKENEVGVGVVAASASAEQKFMSRRANSALGDVSKGDASMKVVRLKSRVDNRVRTSMFCPSPPTNSIGYAHGIIPDEIGIFPNLYCQTQIVSTSRLLPFDISTLRNAIGTDIQLIPRPPFQRLALVLLLVSPSTIKRNWRPRGESAVVGEERVTWCVGGRTCWGMWWGRVGLWRC